MQQLIRKHYRFNFGVGIIDAAFFGLGWGFSSFGTVIPLFVSQMTGSAILIGLIPAIHAVGWQLPQLFTANQIARLRRYKPLVMLMTIQERIPFIGLALAAWLLPRFGAGIILPATFFLLIWQGLGAGFTANPWQSMIAKIIPAEILGSFYGIQAAVANIVISGAAILAGYLIDHFNSPLNFALCFGLASLGYGASMAALSFTREPRDDEKIIPATQASVFKGMGIILRRDRNFAAFMGVRVIYQFATMGFAFYIVYALRKFNMDAITAGYMTAALTISQTIANASMGWLSDRVGHKKMLVLGMISVAFSSLLAWAAPSLHWFYLVFIISAVANVAYWTIGMVLVVEFGTEAERPIYIGMSNTLVAPFTILAPILGGWIADVFGYQTTFLLSALGGIIVTLMMIFLVQNPRDISSERIVYEPD